MLLGLLLLLLLPKKNDSVNDSYGLEVKFSSKNFKNILTWSTSNIKGVRYNVMYKLYGNDCWYKKPECTNITQNWCDLTNETSRYEEQYYGKVIMSNQDWMSDRFYPLIDTILDPPKVNLFSSSTSITINLTHVVENLSSIYIGLKYEIICGASTVESEELYYRIEHLSPQTTYCVSARLLYTRHSIFSNKTCIETKPGQTEERGNIMLYVLAFILVIFTVFVAGYGVHKYIHVGNLQQPQILNITSNNNNNVILVDAHNITINVIKIESGKSNLQSTMMADKEETTQAKKDLYFKDVYDASHASGVTEDDDHGYVRLLEQVPTTRPQVSPYDMPHNLEGPVKPPMAPIAIINKEEDLYGRVKCNSNIASIEENNTIEAHQKADMSEAMFSYRPKNDQYFPKRDVLNHELCGSKESSIGQDADNIDVTDYADFSECDSLFVDWSPTSHHLYIPNIQNKPVHKVITKECQESEGLLPHLYKPIQIEETSEELSCLEQKWELHVKMQE